MAQGQFICPEHVKATGFPKHPVFWERRRDDLAGRELLKRLLPSETRRPPEPHRKMGRRGKRRTSVFAGGENLGAGAIHLPRACEGHRVPKTPCVLGAPTR